MERKSASKLYFIAVLLFIAFLLGGIAFGPVLPDGIIRAPESASMQQARQIGLMMFAYSNDNNGNYPDGKSSTEVFQKLLDGNYATDPSVFYVPLPGKVKAVAGQKLKPENVCYDVTSGVDANSPDELPLVFMTGYKVNYTPGGSAVPLIKPYPPFWSEPRTWSEWWNGAPDPGHGATGIAVTFKSNQAVFMVLVTSANSDGSIPNFVSTKFKPDGKTYRQLTPEGPLPP